MTLSFDAYQAACLRTANSDLEPPLFLATLGLGIAGEAGEIADTIEEFVRLAFLGLKMAAKAGEIADTIKKVVGHGHPANQEEMVEELGDLLWYVAIVAFEYDIPLSAVAEINVEKLKERYPSGFSSERSIDRQGD